jgi:CDP-glucose 4,6-dehydratase
LSLDISKAFLKLDWYPKWNIENAILETVNWYKSYYEEKDILHLTNEQIDRYSSS